MRPRHAGLQRYLPLIGLLAAVSGGCIKPYLPPPASAPHALVKVRSLFHAEPLHAAEYRSFDVDIDDTRWLTNVDTPRAYVPLTRAVRVAPGESVWNFLVDYDHYEQRWVSKDEWVDVPYTETESYLDNGKWCTRTVTKKRSERRSKWEWVTVRVSDGGCERRVRARFRAGGVYLLQYTFVGGACSVVCLEQEAPQPGMAAALHPCIDRPLKMEAKR